MADLVWLFTYKQMGIVQSEESWSSINPIESPLKSHFL